MTDKGVRGRDKLKRGDPFLFNDRSALDGLSLDDMMIGNQERVPGRYTSYPSHARSMLYFHLLPIDARSVSIQGESEQGLRGTFSHKKGGEMIQTKNKVFFIDVHQIHISLVQIALANKYHPLTPPGGETVSTNGEY